jgi:Sulfotransferase family
VTKPNSHRMPSATPLSSEREETLTTTPSSSVRRRRVLMGSLWSLVGLVLLRVSEESFAVHSGKRGTFVQCADRLESSHAAVRMPIREANKTTSVRHEEKEWKELVRSIDNGASTTYKPQEDLLQDTTIDPNTTTRTMSLSHVIFDSNQSTTRVTALDMNRTRSIAFVHVGKAGGNTVRSALPRLECRRLQGGWQEQMRCFRDTYRPESPLARQVNAELHMEMGPKDKDLTNNYDTFLFALRNPVTRAISAYQYLHYNNKKSPWAQKRHPLKDAFYNECFPRLQDLLEALEETDMWTANSSSTRGLKDTPTPRHDSLQRPRYCQRIARIVLKGAHPKVKHINVHLLDNYQFYYQRTIERNPTKDVLAIRTEHLWDDLKELDVAMGGPGEFENEGEVVNRNRKNQRNMYTISTPTFQDDERQQSQLRNLCCILVDEMKIYQEILNRAVNFDYHRKFQTMQDVWASCGIQSLQINKFQDRESDVVQRAKAGTYVPQPQPIIHFSWSKWRHASCPNLKLANGSDAM